MVKLGDYVTRKSYNNDIVFRIIDIKENNSILYGVCVRLMADSPIDDLVVCDKNVEEDDNFGRDLMEYEVLNRNDFFYLPGKVLHIDGDKDFLDRCMKFYKKNRIKAFGFYLSEIDLPENVYNFLKKYNPDILVITGHDALYRKKKNNNDYKNTDCFVKAVREARRFEKSHEKLIIIAGACQSNYEELIKAGANFASSPKRINIHALDPAIIATSLSFSDKNQKIDLINILSKTKYGSDGIGGIITKGTMYVGFPRNK
ncbi:MAG: sporulation peptidase YabG [Bacilli bacterium]|nr:sporulation peptidase YabG [Bacilli bacterium]